MIHLTVNKIKAIKSSEQSMVMTSKQHYLTEFDLQKWEYIYIDKQIYIYFPRYFSICAQDR